MVNTTTQENNQVNVPERGTNIINVGWQERVLSAGVGGYLFAAGLKNLTKRPIKGLLQTAIGGFLLYRGSSGNCPVYTSLGKTGDATHASSVNIRTCMMVNKPRHEVYQFWRRLENLPRFMKHLLTVKELDAKRSHWEAVIPGNIGTLKWDAEIVKEREGEFIGWQSLPNATIENAGKVEFRDIDNGLGTELDVTISYRPPAGEIGSGIASLLNPVFEKLIKQDILNFKQYIESNEQPVYGGQQEAGNIPVH
ncbi:MAG TPA: SRPBCC family protein [Chitinophagaceae bacterium]|nr:SRPBCC family protein [Chitinophagaceae bacterium]